MAVDQRERRTTLQFAGYAALLIAVLFGGYGLGRLTDGAAAAPAAPRLGGAGTPPDGGPGMPMPMGGGYPPPPHAGGMAMPPGAPVGGLSLSEAGLTLVPITTSFPAARPARLAFRIVGAGGTPVRTFAIVHDKPLHLIVIRRDLAGYQHLHPAMAADGTWSIDLTLPGPGMYRMIADFTAVVGGRSIPVALGTDLTVAGAYRPAPLPAPARSAVTAGYTVGYAGTPGTGSVQPILMTVTGAGHRPAALQPYLGAYGHLVMIRQGDLAYVHVHPEPALADGKVKFWLTAPSRGTYRMFFDFRVAGQVHDASWTVVVS